MRVLVHGSIAYDRIMNFNGRFEEHIIPEQIRKLNVSFAVDEFRETFGGSAGNIAYNLHLLQEKAVLSGSVGNDFGKYRQRFEQMGIDLSGIKVYEKTLTPAAYIMTDKKDNQISGFFVGAMKFYAKKPKIKRGDLAIIAPGNPNESLDLIDWYQENRIPFIFDPGQQVIQFTRNQLRQAIKTANLFIVNDYELSLTLKITGYDRPSLLANAGVLVVTLGEKGSLIEIMTKEKSKAFVIRSVKAKKVKDPTGCGDAYRAGLIKGLALAGQRLDSYNYLSIPWLMIGQLGSLAAVYAIEKYGTQTHFYHYKDFQQRFYQEFKTKI